jgi:cytochrome b561-like protein
MIIVALTAGALVLVKIPNTDPMTVDALAPTHGRRHFAPGPDARSTGRAYANSASGAGLDWQPDARRSGVALTPAALCVRAGPATSGLYLAFQTGLPDIVFGGHGALPLDFWIFPTRTVHYVISRLLMALIALHVAGALYHTFILRDGLLRRMWFGKRVQASPSAAGAVRGRSLS